MKYPDVSKLSKSYISGELFLYATIKKYLGVQVVHRITFEDFIGNLIEKHNKYFGIFTICKINSHESTLRSEINAML